MKFLIVGSNGFIGCELMKCLDFFGIEKVGSSLADFPSNNQISGSIDKFYSQLKKNVIARILSLSQSIQEIC